MEKKQYGKKTIIFLVFDALEYTVEDFFKERINKQLMSFGKN